MTESIKESYLSEVYSKQTSSNQTGLDDFSISSTEDFGTTIAVVRDPVGGITEVCDEFIQELGMPLEELNAFREVREELNAETDTEAHNIAAKESQLKDRYLHHIRNNQAARQQIKNLADRVNRGETITLVCFEGEKKWCHRHILQTEIQKHMKNKI